MGEYTPGPWEVSKYASSYDDTDDNYSVGYNDTDGDYWDIAKLEPLRANRLADARLIAAAPELLAACIDALEVEENMAQCPDSELAKRLRAAIAKAKGEV